MATTYLDSYINCQTDLLKKYNANGSSFVGRYSVSTKSISNNGKYILKFKYDDNCRFTYAWQFACRGTTFITESDQDEQYFSLNKFFNSHEIEKYYGKSLKDFLLMLKNEGYNFIFLPKYDGSCMHCFTDNHGIKHRYTLGSVEKNKIGKSEFDYYTVTDHLLKQSYPEIYDFLDQNKGWSLIAELITPHNHVKTIYNFDMFDNADDINTGFIKPLVFVNPNGLPTFSSINHTFKWTFDENNYDIIKANAFDSMIANATEFGINPEGLVAYAIKDEICFPIAKFKRPEYFQFVETNEDEIMCKLQMAKINGQIDDIPMTDKQQKHIDSFEQYLNKTGNQLTNSELFKEFLTQRQFATKIESLPENLKIYKHAFFQIRTNGFEFESGYNTIVKLLKTINKSNKKTTLEIFQETEGTNWFKK